MSEEETKERESSGNGEASGESEGSTQAADRDSAKEEIQKLEEGDPPKDLEDWPEGAAKYETFGGAEGDHGYHEGPEEKLGPSSLRHREDGSVEVAGEKVDNPDEYKGDPIPGGPTDPDAPKDLTTEKIRGQSSDDDSESENDDESSEEPDRDDG